LGDLSPVNPLLDGCMPHLVAAPARFRRART